MENVVISLLRNPGLKRTLKATKFQKNIQTRRVTSKMEQSPMGPWPQRQSRTGVRMAVRPRAAARRWRWRWGAKKYDVAAARADSMSEGFAVFFLL